VQWKVPSKVFAELRDINTSNFKVRFSRLGKIVPSYVYALDNTKEWVNWRYDPQPNDIQPIDTQHDDTQHKKINKRQVWSPN
jgi:hypothetical protein